MADIIQMPHPNKDVVYAHIRKQTALRHAERQFQAGLEAEERGDLERAKYLYSGAKLHPGALNNLGTIAFNEGQYLLAQGYYEDALKCNPGYYRAHYNLAILSEKCGRVDQAIGHYSVAIRQGSLDAKFNFALLLVEIAEKGGSHVIENRNLSTDALLAEALRLLKMYIRREDYQSGVWVEKAWAEVQKIQARLPKKLSFLPIRFEGR